MGVLIDRARGIYRWIDGRSGGVVGILAQSVARFAEMGGGQTAATLAYYALFSLFPLTLFLVALVGSVLESDVAYYQTLQFIRSIFPFSGDVVEKNLAEVIQRRGTISLLGLAALLWSASGFFHTLGFGINRAWPKVKLRSFVQSRLVALGMIGALVLLFLLSLITSTVSGVLPAVLDMLGVNTWLLKSTAWRIVLWLVPALFTFLLFTAVYRWVPNKTVRWRAVLIGALTITLSWEAAKTLFGLYLRSGFARYEFVYGSLGTLIALMVWIYLSNLLALFGAFLVATLDMRADQLHAAQEHEKVKPDREIVRPSRDAARADAKPAGVNGKIAGAHETPSRVYETTGSAEPPAANKGLRG